MTSLVARLSDVFHRGHGNDPRRDDIGTELSSTVNRGALQESCYLVRVRTRYVYASLLILSKGRQHDKRPVVHVIDTEGEMIVLVDITLLQGAIQNDEQDRGLTLSLQQNMNAPFVPLCFEPFLFNITWANCRHVCDVHIFDILQN